jgi:hypothetical protein
MNEKEIRMHIISWIIFPILILIATEVQQVFATLSGKAIVASLFIVFGVLPVIDIIMLVSWLKEGILNLFQSDYNL